MLRQVAGDAAEGTAVDFILRRLQRLPLRLAADLDQFVGVTGDPLEVLDGNGRNLRRISPASSSLAAALALREYKQRAASKPSATRRIVTRFMFRSHSPE
jgi:hypothetical protein